MKSSPLSEIHQKLGAKLLPFAGWEMPIQYAGIVSEHRAVRDSLGIFDISHMAQFDLSGSGAGDWLNSLLTNDVAALGDGEGQYTLMLNEKGGVIDDMIIYRWSEDHFFLVVNASKESEDWDWLNSHLSGPVKLANNSSDLGAVAVQGPDTQSAWSDMRPDWILPERNGIAEFPGGVIVCRTGYTGEDGFELFAPIEAIGNWFTEFLEAGATPCGLGARDTLRLEKCYPLNGSDLGPEKTPLEAGLGFFVKLGKADGFIGSDVLVQQKADGLLSRLVALKSVGKSPPPRHDFEVALPDGGDVISTLTSGSHSPSLGTGIAMAYLPAESAKTGTLVDVIIRDRRFPFEVVKKPFV